MPTNLRGHLVIGAPTARKTERLLFEPSALIVAGITDTLGVCARVPDTRSVTPRADSAFAATDEAKNLSHVHQQLLTAARQAFPSAPVHPEAQRQCVASPSSPH